MRNIKSVNEFFDFLKRNDDEENKIALQFINRLKKVTTDNPYDIKNKLYTNTVGKSIGYEVIFDDTPIVIRRVEYNKRCKENNYTLSKYRFLVSCEGEYEEVNCREKYQEILFELVEKIYNDDINRKKIDKINTNINPAADRL